MTADAAGEPVPDPLTVIVRLIAAVEESLGEERIRGVILEVIPGRITRGRVARALTDNPQVLRTGRSPSVWSVGKLLVALRKTGACQIAAPRCCDCDRVLSSLHSRSGGLWTCGRCANPPQQCAGCGRWQRVSTRDRHGRPRCQSCPDNADAMEELIRLVRRLDPSLSKEAVHSAVEASAVRPTSRRRLAWTVLERPELLTGAGAHAPAPAMLRFIEALIEAGAQTITRPGSPGCGQIKALSERLEGRRVCARCYEMARAIECDRCGQRRPAKYRDAGGRPVCSECLSKDPASREECTGCQRHRRVVTRTVAGPFCKQCRPRPAVACSICGQTGVCEVSRATGRPWCGRCRERWTRCHQCRIVAPIRGGTIDAPLCAACLNPDPAFWGRCPVCGITWQFGTRACQRCALDHKLGELLSAGSVSIRLDFERFRLRPRTWCMSFRW